MSSILETRGTPQFNVHFVRSSVPPVVEGNFGGYYFEQADDSLGEFLEDQESLYQLLQSEGRRQVTLEAGESSQARNAQIESDADYARSLQEIEDQLLDAPLPEPTEVTPANTPSRPETLAQGTESGGLSDKLIAYLEPFKYKPSRSAGPEECVICLMEYKKGDKLITLPCQHEYHSKCITKWLKISKACPVCTEKVFGP